MIVDVAKATPIIGTVSPVNITYGTALASGQISGSATFTVGGSLVTVPGTFVYTTDAGQVLHAGNGQTESILFIPTDTTDYRSVATTATVNVAEATPSVTVDALNIGFGTELDDTRLSGTVTATVNGNSVDVPGTFTFTSADGVVPNGGSGQTEAVTFTPADTSDYSTVSTHVGGQRVEPGHADRLGQYGEPQLWNGLGQFAAQRSRDLYPSREHGPRAGHLHLHQQRRRQVRARATDKAKPPLSRRPTRRHARRCRRT